MKLPWLERWVPNIVLLFLFEDGRNHGFWAWLTLIGTAFCFARVFLRIDAGMGVEMWVIFVFVCGFGFTGTNVLKIWLGAKFGENGLKAIDKADGKAPPADAPAA